MFFTTKKLFFLLVICDNKIFICDIEMIIYDIETVIYSNGVVICGNSGDKLRNYGILLYLRQMLCKDIYIIIK